MQLIVFKMGLRLHTVLPFKDNFSALERKQPDKKI